MTFSKKKLDETFKEICKIQTSRAALGADGCAAACAAVSRPSGFGHITYERNFLLCQMGPLDYLEASLFFWGGTLVATFCGISADLMQSLKRYKDENAELDNS